MRKYVIFSLLVTFVFQTSSAGVGVSITSETNDVPFYADDSGQSQTGTTKRAVAENLDRLASELAKKRLSTYVLNRYASAPAHTRERFAANFATVAKTDPRAEIHPYYLVSLEKKLKGAATFKEDGALFGAYAHVLLSLREDRIDVEASIAHRKEELQNALRGTFSGNLLLSEDDARTGEETLKALKANLLSSSDAEKMRMKILEEKIGPNTAYFKAYALFQEKLRTFSGKVEIPVDIPHEKQLFNLSCEANSLRDFVNAYRLSKKEHPLGEGAMVFLLPSSPEPPKHENGVRIWADPSKEFVGRIDGRQSSNPSKLTGYGIHADGVLPYVRRELKKYSLRIEKGAFDSKAITESLLSGHPVVFWYVLNTDANRGFAQLEWKTPEGKTVRWFVGEHTGIIVGASFDDDWNLKEVSYYEWRNSALQTESFESLSRKAKWFNEALYAKADESSSGAVKSATKRENAPMPKVRKKNVRRG